MRKYIVGKKACLVKVDSPLIEGWERCEDIKMLRTCAGRHDDESVEGVRWKGSKIPEEMFGRVLATVARYPHMETGFHLWYNADKGAWKITCPKQKGTSVNIRFETEESAQDGFLEIGTIHTHPQMSAFWSGQDRASLKGRYAVCFVLGLTDGRLTSWKCTVFTPSAAYDQDPHDVVDFEGELPKPAKEPVKEWVDTIDDGIKESRKPAAQPARNFPFQLETAKAMLSLPMARRDFDDAYRHADDDDCPKEQASGSVKEGMKLVVSEVLRAMLDIVDDTKLVAEALMDVCEDQDSLVKAVIEGCDDVGSVAWAMDKVMHENWSEEELDKGISRIDEFNDGMEACDSPLRLVYEDKGDPECLVNNACISLLDIDRTCLADPAELVDMVNDALMSHDSSLRVISAEKDEEDMG